MSAPAVHRGDGSGRMEKQSDDSALDHDHTVKPEIDLQSWASLGGNIKPSRTECKQMRSWKRMAAR
jgi:hypothetical protein